MVSSKGGRAGFVYPDQQRRYKALRRAGKTKTSAARIANSWHSRSTKATSRRRKR